MRLIESKTRCLIPISPLIVAAIIFLRPDSGMADSNVTVAGKSAQASVKFKVVIPQSLSMSIVAGEQEEFSTIRYGQSGIVISDWSVDDEQIAVSAPGTLSEDRSIDIFNNLPEMDKNDQPKQRDRQYVLCSP